MINQRVRFMVNICTLIMVLFFLCSPVMAEDVLLSESEGNLPPSAEVLDLETQSSAADFETDQASASFVQIVHPSHIYDVISKTDPDCETAGEIQYGCRYCDLTYTVDIPALGHKYEITSETEVGCEQEGKITYTCSRCSDTYTEITPAIGHDYEITAETAPSCEKEGCTTYTCSHCGSSDTQSIAALGHKYEITSKTEAGCDREGQITYTCSQCKNCYSEILPALGHQYAVSKSGRNSNISVYTCSCCGRSYQEVLFVPDNKSKEEILSFRKETAEPPKEVAASPSSAASSSVDTEEIEEIKEGSFNMLSIITLALSLAILSLGAGYVFSYLSLFRWAAEKKKLAILALARGSVK